MDTFGGPDLRLMQGATTTACPLRHAEEEQRRQQAKDGPRPSGLAAFGLRLRRSSLTCRRARYAPRLLVSLQNRRSQMYLLFIEGSVDIIISQIDHRFHSSKMAEKK
jgi:hypothetical protein